MISLKHSSKITTLVVVFLFNIFYSAAESQFALPGYSGGYAYRYSLTSQQMQRLITGVSDTVPLSVITATPTDSCPVNQVDTINSGIGQWVWAWRTGSKLNFRVENRPPFAVAAFGEHKGVVQVRVQSGTDSTPIPDAVVTLGGKRLKYNSSSQLYEIKAPAGNKLMRVVVEYGGFVDTRLCVRQPERDHYRNYTYYRPMPRHYTFDENNALRYSYFVTDKPVYRPSDSIQWKAVVLNRRGVWVDEPMTLAVEEPYSSFRKVIGIVEPEVKGVYSGCLHFHDSLNMRSQTPYSLVLSTKKGRVAARFFLHDYELKSLKVNIVPPTDVVIGDTCVFLVRSTDEKGDFVSSGTATLTLRSGMVNSMPCRQLFVPDTLASYTFPLSQSGVTPLSVNTISFPEVNDMNVYWTLSVKSDIYETVTNYGSFSVRNKPAANTGTVQPQPIEVEVYEQADTVGFDVYNPGRHRFRYAIYVDNRLVTSDYTDTLVWRCAAPKAATYSIFVDSSQGSVVRRIQHRNTDLRVTVCQPGVLQPGMEAEVSLRVTDSKGKPVADADVTALSHTAKFGNRIALPSKWSYNGRKIKDIAALEVLNPAVTPQRHTIVDRELQRLYRTNSSVYYSLLMPGADKPFVYSQHIGGQQSQIAPFVVKDGELQPVEIVYIDNKPVYIGWATNVAPYSFAITPGEHNIAVRTANAQYSIKGVNIEPETKTWLSVKALDVDKRHNGKSAKVGADRVSASSSAAGSAAFSASAMPPFLTPSEERYFNSWFVMPYTVNPRCGLPYIAFNDSCVVSLEGHSNSYSPSGVALVPGLSGSYSETSLSDTTAILPWRFIPNSHTHFYPKSLLLIADRDCSRPQAKSKRNKDRGRSFTSSALPSTADSLLSAATLHEKWLERIDQRRSYCYFYDGPDDRRGDCSLIVLYADNAERPINYIVSDSLHRWIYGGNVNSVYNLKAQRYTVSLLYPDSRMVSVDVDVKAGGHNYILAPVAGAEVSAQSSALTDSIRGMVERTMYRTGFDDFGEFYRVDEALDGMVYGVQASPSHRRPMAAMKSMAAADVANTSAAFEEEAAVEEIAAEGAGIVGSFRSDFSDVAYWQPNLRTDRNGEVKFRVTYPDDLTRWNEYFVAMKGRSRGYAQTSVVTRLARVATLATPRFVLQGDSFGIIGQFLNYTGSAIQVERTVYLNDTLVARFDAVDVESSHTDRFVFPRVSSADSLSVAYLYRAAGESDGERRVIPVYRPGLEAVDGGFALLNTTDTTIVVGPDTTHGAMTVRLMGDMLSVLFDEVEHTAKNKLNTNDMLASQLMALLVREQVCGIRGTRFAEKGEIRALIRKLEQSRHNNLMWSWWGTGGRTAPWISTHVYTALCRAQAAGYQVESIADRDYIVRNLIAQAARLLSVDDYSGVLSIAQIVSQLGFPLETRNLVASLPIDSLYGNERIVYHTLSAWVGNDVPLSVIDSLRHTDLLGGEYYSFGHYAVPFPAKRYVNPLYSQLETTLSVLNLLSEMPTTAERDSRIDAAAQWILRQRSATGWHNAYISARIVDALLQLSIVEAETYSPLSVTLKTDRGERVITEFPYELDSVSSAVTIEKHGTSDLYVSHWQRWFDPTPEVRQAELAVDTRIDSTLQAGVETDIVVSVTASADAEYVVIRMPIPAGSSYADRQPYSYAESHRENLRHMAQIYYERLTAGTHEFRVRLNPRFSGRYTVNPAQVEMIYYPVFNANNDIKCVEIR